MLSNPTKLLTLIDEYRCLRQLENLTPQTRGQRFNSFISELLQCWEVSASAGLRGSGEIDVAFELNGRNFVLEAKWENSPIATDSVAKLQKRVRQRLAGTIGLLLSMSGFTPDAIRDLKEGEQLSVILLSGDYLEGMLSGFVSPEEAIGGAVRRASNYGEGHPSLQSMFDGVAPSAINASFDSSDTLGEQPLIVDAIASFQSRVLACDFSMRQSGVAELSESEILLTLEQGIYTLDLRNKSLSLFLGISNCSRNALVAEDGCVYIVKGRGVARIRNGEFKIVAGGLIGNVCLFPSENREVMAFSNGHAGVVQDWAKPQVTLLGESLGDERRTTVNYSAGCGMNAASIGQGRFLIVGSYGTAIVEPGTQTFLLNRDQHMGLARLSDDRLILSSGGVDLYEFDVSNNSTKHVAKLRLQGLVSELATSLAGGGYLFAHYPKANGKTGGAVIRWRY